MFLLTDTLTRSQDRLSDLQPINPALNPVNALAHEFKSYHIQGTPSVIMPATPPPQTTSQTYRYADAALWPVAHNKKMVGQLKDQQAVMLKLDATSRYYKPIGMHIVHK